MFPRLCCGALLALCMAAAEAGTWVYTCDDPTQQTEFQDGLTNSYHGACTGGAANGYWIEVPSSRWWEAEIDGEDFRDLLLVILFCFCAAWTVRFVMDVVRGRR